MRLTRSDRETISQQQASVLTKGQQFARLVRGELNPRVGQRFSCQANDPFNRQKKRNSFFARSRTLTDDL